MLEVCVFYAFLSPSIKRKSFPASTAFPHSLKWRYYSWMFRISLDFLIFPYVIIAILLIIFCVIGLPLASFQELGRFDVWPCILVIIFIIVWHKLLPAESRVLIDWDVSRAGPYVSVLNRSGLRVSSAIVFTEEQRKELWNAAKI